MGGLSNDYVEKLMYRISTKPQSFKGVKPCDLFLNFIENQHHFLKPGDCFIINLSSSNHKGSHFISLIILSNRRAEYFDPFGLHYSLDSNINKALVLAKLKTTIFEKSIQDLSSQFCGLYCGKLKFFKYKSNQLRIFTIFFSVAYLLWRQTGLTKESFGNLFHKDKRDLNDRIVVDVIKLFIEEKKY